MVKTKPAEKLPEFLYYMSQEEAIYNLLKDYIPIQSQAIESSIQSIETKTGFIMASIGVFVPIIVTNILTAQPKTKWILITGTCFALITLLFNIFCMWGRYFRISPNIRNFYDSFKNRNQPDTAREELLALAYNDFEYNRDILRQKATSFNISLVTFGISILFIIIGVFV